MSQDHRQPSPAEPPSLIQNSGETAASDQPGQVLHLNVRHIQRLWQLPPQGLGAGGFGEDQKHLERPALAVGQEKQSDGGVQRNTRLLILETNF